MEDKGWIKLHRKVEDWEWYTDPVVSRLFIHLLIKANVRDVEWQGITVRRGQFVTSLRILADALMLTKKQIRLGLKKLQRTNEILVFGAHRFSLITICKFECYQGFANDGGHAKGTQRARKGQTEGTQRATTKEYKELKNNNIDDDVAREAIPVEELSGWLRSNAGGIWEEQTAMVLGVRSVAELREFYPVFQREMIAQGRATEKIRDIRAHFVNLMRKKLKDKNNENRRNNGRGDNRPTKAERDAEVEAYVRSVLGGGDA